MNIAVSKKLNVSQTCLFSTKRLIVDVIRFQPGETLTEILDSTAGTEQVRNLILAQKATTANVGTHSLETYTSGVFISISFLIMQPSS